MGVITTRFATFNVHSGRPRDARPNLKMFRSAVAALEADVVGLQEVDNGMVRSGRVNMSGEAANAAGAVDFFVNARRRWDGGTYGNTLLVKGEMSNTEVIRFARAKLFFERRIAQLATVTVNDMQWNVANTHLSLHASEHSAQLREVAVALSLRPGPRVLMGDFNMMPEAVHDTLDPLGWTVLESGFTFPSWQPDHTVDFICVQDAVAESIGVKSLDVSDHAALVAELRPA